MDSTSIGTDQWIRQTYSKLRRMAQSKMYSEQLGHTLSATSLIHEVYVRLSQSPQERHWQTEREFLSVMAMEMRRVLIDSARRKKTLKRGRDLSRTPLPDVPDQKNDVAQQIIDISEAVSRLEELHPEKAELVKLRYFLGLTATEAAETLGVSRATAARYWTFARAWLLDELSCEPSQSDLDVGRDSDHPRSDNPRSDNPRSDAARIYRRPR